MKTGFGERVHELRKRIMAVGTPLRDWDELIEVELPARITKAVAEAVADERERMLASVAIMFDRGSEQSRDKLFASIRNAIACSEPVPRPEPITIATMMEKLLAGYPVWKDECDLRSDLTALVQAQARRSADLCMHLSVGHCREDWRAACHECHRLILSDAGLE